MHKGIDAYKYGKEERRFEAYISERRKSFKTRFDKLETGKYKNRQIIE